MATMKAIKQIYGAGVNVGPGEIFEVSEERAEDYAARGLAEYYVRRSATYQTKVIVPSLPGRQAK